MDNEPSKEDITKIANDWVMKNVPIPSLADEKDYMFLIRSLEEHLVKFRDQRKLLLPNLVDNNETIMIASDYGGEHADSNYYTYSFLIMAYEAMSFWSEESQKIRKKYKLDTPRKEIAFKDLSYGPIDRCLDEWLNLSDHLLGLSFTLVINKKVISATGTQNKQTAKEVAKIISDKNLGVWKPQVAEKLLRVLHPMCYLVSVLSRNGQKLFWMTDEDAIIENNEKADSLGKLFASILSIYTGNKYQTIGYAKPFDDIDSKLNFNDLLSIPDLVAGSIESLYTRKDKSENPQVKEGTNKILTWHAHQGVGLKKYAMIVDVADDKQFRTGMIEFEPIDDKREIRSIPVWL